MAAVPRSHRCRAGAARATTGSNRYGPRAVSRSSSDACRNGVWAHRPEADTARSPIEKRYSTCTTAAAMSPARRWRRTARAARTRRWVARVVAATRSNASPDFATGRPTRRRKPAGQRVAVLLGAPGRIPHGWERVRPATLDRSADCEVDGRAEPELYVVEGRRAVCCGPAWQCRGASPESAWRLVWPDIYGYRYLTSNDSCTFRGPGENDGASLSNRTASSAGQGAATHRTATRRSDLYPTEGADAATGAQRIAASSG